MWLIIIFFFFFHSVTQRFIFWKSPNIFRTGTGFHEEGFITKLKTIWGRLLDTIFKYSGHCFVCGCLVLIFSYSKFLFDFTFQKYPLLNVPSRPFMITYSSFQINTTSCLWCLTLIVNALICFKVVSNISPHGHISSLLLFYLYHHSVVYNQSVHSCQNNSYYWLVIQIVVFRCICTLILYAGTISSF